MKLPRWKRGYAGLIVFGMFVLFVLFSLPQCTAGFTPALRELNTCHEAVEVLGSPIEQAFGFGFGNGRPSQKKGRVNAHAEFPVQGPKGTGEFRYVARPVDGDWKVIEAKLDVKGRVIDVLSCGGPSGVAPQAPTKERLRSASELTGKVTAITGAAPKVKVGDLCTIAIAPTSDDFRERGWNCHVKVKCAATVLYGWEGSGSTHCQLAEGVVVKVNDVQGAAAKDDPLLDVDIAKRQVVVSDDGKDATYSVTIAIDRE